MSFELKADDYSDSVGELVSPYIYNQSVKCAKVHIEAAQSICITFQLKNRQHQIIYDSLITLVTSPGSSRNIYYPQDKDNIQCIHYHHMDTLHDAFYEISVQLPAESYYFSIKVWRNTWSYYKAAYIHISDVTFADCHPCK